MRMNVSDRINLLPRNFRSEIQDFRKFSKIKNCLPPPEKLSFFHDDSNSVIGQTSGA